MLVFQEHPSPTYAPRTRENAKLADLTAAFCVDFNTAGERLTKAAAGERFVGIALACGDEAWLQGARRLYSALRRHRAVSVNIAGNGLATLSRQGWSQEDVNAFVLRTLAKVQEFHPITELRCGGQTGADIAGAVAGMALGLRTVVLMPRGFMQRDAAGQDAPRQEADLRKQVEIWAARVRPP